ncbi:hypothetical protein T8J41_18120 [Nitratireductor rhodophyticola]|uniref:hypothetical protein n=1 Tax=Nitratireductor rhodophyticola TaxID=2854036 RepID=UPI0008141D51|nr:hypothetical protein [Nitratireductor rhodophyticola]MEC9243393.1 hypothetical protein [Pseudomonadota bacterium]WPZ14023.1 hypothetical protein T8J41_18120 [Nitratireductor rhodophyticola]
MSFVSEEPRPQEIAPRRRLTLAQAVGFVSVTLFISTEVAAASAAGIWGLSGLLHLQPLGEIILSAIVGIPALFAMVRCGQLAFAAETDPENN